MREKSWEYAGRTVDEAVDIALEELGLERDDIYVEILEEPKKGFLGLGDKEARVRVELIGEWEVIGKARDKPAGIEEEEETGPGGKDADMAPTGELVDSTSKPVGMIEDILGIFGIEAVVEAKDSLDSIIIDIWGEDIAVLIGKNGNTLDAIQYLVNIGCRRSDSVSKRIVVDIEGYRKRRKVRLEKEAEEMATRVLQQKKSMKLPPMSPSERKTVHLVLSNINGVRTESEGEGPDRRVVIHPIDDRST